MSEESDNAKREADLALMEKHLLSLSEHFDTVHIFCTNYDPGKDGGTYGTQKGCGNWFARYGQIKEWTIKEEEGAKQSVKPESE